MFDPQMSLLVTVLRRVAESVEAGDEAAWGEAGSAMGALPESREENPELAAAVDARDAAALRAVLDEFESGARHLPAQDRGVLKRAMKAYRKTHKVTILDDESSLGGGAFSGGRESTIVGITPPTRYPREVWDELVKQKRLTDEGQGLYGLPPGG